MNAKIEHIRELGTTAGVDVGSLIDEFYFPEIRNSVFHADYVLTDILAGRGCLPGSYYARSGKKCDPVRYCNPVRQCHPVR
jgi:hypothetical protein